MNTEELQYTTVAELVAKDYRTAEVFKKHGIDFCCGGKKTIEKVCRDKAVDIEVLRNEIAAIQNNAEMKEQAFNEWTLTFLIDYIVNVHHAYVKRNMQLITEFAQKVALVHGEHNPENKDIAKLWDSIVSDLNQHLKKEEEVLFPYIKKLEQYTMGESEQYPQAVFGSAKNPIRMMENEHDLVGNLMKHIEIISNHFTPPAHACNTYRVLYAKLEEFQNDLHTHIHLENNILFPKAIALENASLA